MNKSTLNKYIWLFVFSTAMAFMESAVVIYLRELYYPNGFSFPLKAIEPFIALVEIIREAATIIMLISIAVIAGKKRIVRFAYFLFSFAVWDIFYYIFLKLFTGWPESLLTWDILFLIPLTWTGPVITPVINSLTMILIAVSISYLNDKYGEIVKLKTFIILLIVGSIIVLYSYIQPYYLFMHSKFSLLEMLNINNVDVLSYSGEFIPIKFNWPVFSTGVVFHLFSIGYFLNRNTIKNKNKLN